MANRFLDRQRQSQPESGNSQNRFMSGNKTKNRFIQTTKDPMQRVVSEINNKKDVLRRYNLPIPGEEEDDRNFIEKKLNTPKKTGFLGDLFDVLSRGQYASANIAKSLVDDKEDSFGEVVQSGLRGLKGEDRTSYSDVLAETGMEPGWKRSALGFAGDVLLDPTTYLTLGYGAAARAGGKAGAKGLGKLISKATGKQILDKGGVKFAGLSLIPQTVVDKGLQKTGLTALGQGVRNSKPGQVLGKAFIPDFREAGTDSKAWETFTDLKSGYKNKLAYGQSKAVDDAVKFGKKLTEAERKELHRAIQDRTYYQAASQKIKDAADEARKTFDTSAQKEMDLGLLKNLHQDYVPGIYPEKGKTFLEGIRYNPSIRASIGKHGKQKKFNTLQEAIDYGLKPETDMAKLMGARQVASARATTTQEFIDETVDKLGQKITVKDIDNLPDNMSFYLPRGSLKFFPQDTVDLLKANQKGALLEVPADAIRKGVGVSKNVPVVALPKQIADELNNFKKSAWDEGTKGFIKNFYDKPLGLWKAYATATNPGFHIRNAASNLFQTYLNNGKTAIDPRQHAKAFGALMSDKDNWLGRKFVNKTLDVGGQQMTYKELKELMKKEGVLDQGWFDKEIGKQIGDDLAEGTKSKVKKYLDPNLINPLSTNNALIKTGRKIGGAVENQSRALNFLGDLSSGLSAKDAAKNTNKFLFDYGKATDFEKNYMRRIIPFYTWLRKNLPLQTEQLAKQPGKYAAIQKGINAVEQNSDPVDEQYLPEYMQNWVRTPFTQGENPVYLNPNLPYGDLDKLNPMELERSLLGSITPFVKAPMELTTNRNFFFESPIERYKGQLVKAPGYMPNLPEAAQKLLGAKMIENKDTGEEELQIPAKMRYLTKQVPFAENISRAIEYDDDKLLNHLLSFLAGAKVAPYDIEKGKQNALYDERQDLRDIIDKLENEGVLPEGWNEEPKKRKFGVFSR